MNIVNSLLDFLLANAGPILESLAVILVGFALMAFKRLPKMLLAMAKSFEEEARKTETEADDAAAKLLVAVASALAAAAEKELGPKKSGKS